jgi:hypothetical protein
MASPGDLDPLVVANMDEQFRNYSGNWRLGLAAYQQAGADYATLNADIVDGILLDMYDRFGIKTWFDLYSSFLPAEAPLPLALDTMEKQADWFVAALSASTGQDLRSLFASEYGFPFDDAAWPGILSAVEARVAARTWYPPGAVRDQPGPPAAGIRLLSNQPNPFTRGTELRFVLASPAQTALTVHDVNGRLLASLLHGLLPAGEHRVAWDGRDESGRLLGSGVYWTRLVTPGGVCRGQVTVIR